MQYTITLSSDEFGVEGFDYDSIDEMLEGFERLCTDILEQQDGIERTLSVRLKPDHRAG